MHIIYKVRIILRCSLFAFMLFYVVNNSYALTFSYHSLLTTIGKVKLQIFQMR